MQDGAREGRKFRILTVINEFTRKCLSFDAAQRLNSQSVIHIRSDNGPAFAAHVVRKWIAKVGAKTLFIEPGSPWENGRNETFNRKLRDERLNVEFFNDLSEAKVPIKRSRERCNTIRPYTSLD
ncbi:MAG: integrase core domain-containing protein [Pseudomonadota bacterium]